MAWDPSESLVQFREALDTFDQRRVAALCAELIERLRNSDTPYPERDAALILSLLRRKRHFTLAQQVADAFIQAGVDSPVIRRHYILSLLDQGNVTAGLAVLQHLITDTADQPEENAEARGLLGRAYKQLYIATGPGVRERRRLFLDQALAAYLSVYRDSQINHWHGINAAALLTRAGREGIRPHGFPDPRESGRAIAAEILQLIETEGDSVLPWDYATAVEACIALGHVQEALDWLDKYLQFPSHDLFELTSVLRQLTEVWQLDSNTELGAQLIALLQATIFKQTRHEELLVGAPKEDPRALRHIDDDRAGLEKIFGRERFRSLAWLLDAQQRCRAVARIEDRYEGGVGTGFLVAGPSLHRSFPGRVLVTNAHVVGADDPQALDPEQALITFRALDRADKAISIHRVSKVLWSSLPHELDTTIVLLDSYPADSSVCPVAKRRPLLGKGASPQALIIGHPSGGEQVMLSIQDNLVLDADDTRLHYRTPTLGGSSGSPVFNSAWELIAVHHKGLTQMPRLHGQAGTYPANQGIWIDRIMARLEEALG